MLNRHPQLGTPNVRLYWRGSKRVSRSTGTLLLFHLEEELISFGRQRYRMGNEFARRDLVGLQNLPKGMRRSGGYACGKLSPVWTRIGLIRHLFGISSTNVEGYQKL